MRTGGRLVYLVVVVACGGTEDPPHPVVRPVRYAEAVVSGGERTRAFAGIARAASEQDLSFRVAGTVATVEVGVGTRIRRGQTLVRLDPGDLELRRQQSEAGLAQARAQARNAQASYERVAALYESGNASTSDFDAARAAYESGKASVTSAQTALRLAEQQVAYTSLAAPIDGSVSRVMVEANEAVGAGQTVVVVIDLGRNPEVEVLVPEAFIGTIRSGQPAEAAFGAVPGERFLATVTEVGTAVAGAAGFPVVVRLDDGEAASNVRPGMAAEVTLLIEGDAGGTGVLVPPEAVEQDHLGSFVYVLVPTDTGDVATAERRAVEVGVFAPMGLEIVSGVESGEYVATAGIRTLTPGALVRLLNSR